MFTKDEIFEFIDYNPDTGFFTWKKNSGTRAIAGNRAGYSMVNGYRSIGVLGEEFYEHRLAWLCMTGQWPKKQIDHINQDRSDNRFVNLREATNGQNTTNRGAWGKSGIRGVYFHDDHPRTKPWSAKININSKPVSLGFFETVEEARKAYCDKAKEVQGDFIHSSILRNGDSS